MCIRDRSTSAPGAYVETHNETVTFVAVTTTEGLAPTKKTKPFRSKVGPLQHCIYSISKRFSIQRKPNGNLVVT